MTNPVGAAFAASPHSTSQTPPLAGDTTQKESSGLRSLTPKSLLPENVKSCSLKREKIDVSVRTLAEITLQGQHISSENNLATLEHPNLYLPEDRDEEVGNPEFDRQFEALQIANSRFDISDIRDAPRIIQGLQESRQRLRLAKHRLHKELPLIERAKDYILSLEHVNIELYEALSKLVNPTREELVNFALAHDESLANWILDQ